MDVELLNLIDRYWDLAYAEGKEGRDHDTEEGDAALCRYEIEKRLRDIEVAVAQAVEFAEYVERQAKGAMVDAAKRFLSVPYADELRQRLNARHGAGDAERSAELTTAWMAGAESVRDQAARDAEDAARYRWIVRRPKSKIIIDSQWGEQRISFYTCDADDFIDSVRERAARAGERG